MCLYHLLKQPVLWFSEVFNLCETENLNFAVYFTINKHSYEQVYLKVEVKSFLYEFLNSGDPLYFSSTCCSRYLQSQKCHEYCHYMTNKPFRTTKDMIKIFITLQTEKAWHICDYNIPRVCLLNRLPVTAMDLKRNGAGLWRHMLETCRRLRRLCRKHLNNVAGHDKIPVKSTHLSRDKRVMSHKSDIMLWLWNI